MDNIPLSIPKFMEIINSVTPRIQTKYISIKELDQLENLLGQVMDIITIAKDELLKLPPPSLTVLLPAMDHIYKEQILSNEDIGALALVSKGLYDAFLPQFGQPLVDICIAEHYVNHPSYDYNVQIYNKEYKMYIPLAVRFTALKRLRVILGRKEYFKRHCSIFSREDSLYMEQRSSMIMDNEFYAICLYCGEEKGNNLEHSCKIKNGNSCRDKYIMNVIHPSWREKCKQHITVSNNDFTIQILYSQYLNVRESNIFSPTHFEEFGKWANMIEFGENELPKFQFDVIKIHNTWCDIVVWPEREFILMEERKKKVPFTMKGKCNGIFFESRYGAICESCGEYRHCHILESNSPFKPRTVYI